MELSRRTAHLQWQSRAFLALTVLIFTGWGAIGDAGAQTSSYGFAWADQPMADLYTPDEFYSYNAGAGPVQISRSGTGTYTVVWGALDPIGVDGGNVQVTAYGSDNETCKVVEWEEASASVACFDDAGAPVDSLFTVLLLKPPGETDGIAYVWANDSSADQYTPNGLYSYNAGGGSVEVTRSGAGSYEVFWDGLASVGANGGNVQVTAYGSGNETCKVSSWGGEAVDVRCFDDAGLPVDTLFTVLFLKPAVQTDGIAYVWADQQFSDLYTPDEFYSYNAGGGAVEVSRSATGAYEVFWDGLAPIGINGGDVQVTAYGSGNETCKVSSWGDDSVGVVCFDDAGLPVDTHFTALFLKPVPEPSALASSLVAMAALRALGSRRGAAHSAARSAAGAPLA